MNELNNLDRFIEAQQNNYEIALAEIKSGKKQSHWMWYVFPQFLGLAMSETSKTYAIKSLGEAEAFLNHPLLGKRLIEISNAILQLSDNNAYAILGSPDDEKLKSSMTLFAKLEKTNLVFSKVLNKFYDGELDEKTINLLSSQFKN